jgi:hypothetical protein
MKEGRGKKKKQKMKRMMPQLARIVSFLSRSTGCSDAF